MQSSLEIFDYFVDDLLSSDVNLLNYELDLLLMQHLFYSIDLDSFKNFNIKENIIIAS